MLRSIGLTCPFFQGNQKGGSASPWKSSKEHNPAVSQCERLDDVLNKPREKPEIEDERDQDKDQEIEKDRDIDRGPTHGM